jgi:hypothetical protein
MDIYSILAILIVILDAVLSLELRSSNNERREKRQFAAVIPNEVKGLFYKTNYSYKISNFIKVLK